MATIYLFFVDYYVLCCVIRTIQSRTHFIWVDNFSKFMARSVPTLNSSVYSSCLWTGMAAFSCDTQFDTTIAHDVEGNTVPAMPDDLFQYAPTVKAAIHWTVNNSRTYYDQSIVKRYDVRNVPPKIDTKRWPTMRSTIDVPHNSTRIVHPVKLLDYNIGSNNGLLDVLKEIYDQFDMGTDDCENYVFINVDENIYWRILKVLLYFAIRMYVLYGRRDISFVFRLCMIEVVVDSYFVSTLVCLWRGGTITNGRPNRSSGFSLVISSCRCSIICFPTKAS